MARAFIYGLLLSLVTAAEFELQGERPKAATEFAIDAHGQAKKQGVHDASHPTHKSGTVTAHLQHSPKTNAAKEHAMTMETQKSASSRTSGAAMVRKDTRQHEALHKKLDETKKQGMKHSKSMIMAREHSRKDARANVEKVETMSIQAQKRKASFGTKRRPIAKAKENKDSKLPDVGTQKQDREQSRPFKRDRPIALARDEDDDYSESSSDVDTQKPNREQSRHLSNAKPEEADQVEDSD